MTRPIVRPATLRVGTINIPVKVGPDDWAECLDRAMDHADLVTVNECFTRRQKRTFRKVAKDRRYHVTMGAPNPIFAHRNVFRRVAANRIKLHGRGPLWPLYPGFNAARWATIARYVTLEDRLPVVSIATHFVPRGPKVPNWWRERARKKSIRKIARRVKFHTKRGRIVILSGDFNMANPPHIPGVVWVAQHGVDCIGIALPDGWEIVRAHKAAFRARTDHKYGITATIRIERKIR